MDENFNNLIKKLKDETTFVQLEKKTLLELHNQLTKKSEKLFTKQWLIARQHSILDDLIFGRNRSTPNQSCTKFSKITTSQQFIESYKVLGHNDYYVSEFLKSIREKPEFLAQLIIKSEKLNSLSFFNSSQLINGVDNNLFSTQYIIPIVFQSLYSNCVLMQDEYYCLQLLKHLMVLQFGTNDLSESNIDLRRMIRKQSCSFNILFKLYTSFSYSAQLFLIQALYEPINQILTDEWFLDIDPDKAMARFSSEELINKFGHPSSKEYKIKAQKYREKIVNFLFNITNSFIDSISSSLYSFPPSLTWLVNQLYKLVSKNNKPNQTDNARKLCCDLIMALYICPAICDPEPYGVISDVQVSNVARHNLMQIANILQVLAMSDDDKDPKAQDLYSKFRNADKNSNCVSDILNNIISIPKTNKNSSSSNEMFDLMPNNDLLSNLSSGSSVQNSQPNQHLIFRTSILIQLNDINRLVLFIRQLNKEQNSDTEESKWLKSIIPFNYINHTLETLALSLNTQKIRLQQSSHNFGTESSEVLTSLLRDSDDVNQVLIVNISDKGYDCPGMLSEEKVLSEYESKIKIRFKKTSNKTENYDLDTSYEPSIKLQTDRDEIRSRHDGSVGISEARSISSDDDDDVANSNRLNDIDDEVNHLVDGLSDFDNFSGRDTPIISGRDTPSSHSHEELQNTSSSRNQINRPNPNPIPNSMNPSRGPQLPITVQKPNREDINDKFCKFEINTVNTAKEEQMSETGWSLDADPPESVANEPINVRLGISSSVSSNLNSNNQITSNNSSNNLGNQVQQAQINAEQEKNLEQNNLNENDQNLNDDHFSVVSDSAAWSTDMINNSDSDFESNSPSKYTPYSTYSSYSSSIITNQSILNEINSNQNRTHGNLHNSPSLTLNTNNNNSNNFHFSNSASSALISADLNKRADNGNNQSEPVKNKLTSIFSSNSNSVKFSLSSTLEKINQNSSINKKISLKGLFNKSSSGSSQAKNSTTSTIQTEPITIVNQAESNNQTDVDYILKKYKSKQTSQTEEAQLVDLSIPANSVDLTKNPSSNSLQNQVQQTQEQNLYDPNNLENSKLFLDAKKKLRIVLSWPDSLSYNQFPNSQFKTGKDNFLVMYLKTQLYDSISLEDKEKEAQLYETIRCVSPFNEQACLKLLNSLKKDYLRRIYYMTYLTKSKQNLLYSLNLIEKLFKRAEWHQKLRTQHFASVVTRMFLETKENENQMFKFIHDFRLLVAVDEKFDLFKKFLLLLKKDYDLIWSGCNDELIQLGHLCLERLLLSKVYSYVMYPNGEIDHYRDSKVSECLNELANAITPSHPMIGIPPIYLNECPWTAAQMELKRLNIYRTPQDKLACIKKCMLNIQNLLAIAKSPVCADDLHPVLIYVIIKANPPTFLSNVQYIEEFYGKQLELEDYYWAQFIFAFSYIKANMLNFKQ